MLRPGPRRAVLARLALTANTPVATQDLVDLLWRDRPPASYAHLVHVYVSRLRGLLQAGRPLPDSDGVLGLVNGGYELRLDDEQLDAATFRRLLREAKTASPEAAIDLHDAALRLWRGGPAADIADLCHHPVVTTLAEERITAALTHAELATSLNAHERSLPWLRELVACHPLHEPLHAALIFALASTGRRVEALTVCHSIRRALADELGVDPSSPLDDLYQDLLRPDLHPSGRRINPSPTPAPAQLPADVGQFAGLTHRTPAAHLTPRHQSPWAARCRPADRRHRHSGHHRYRRCRQDCPGRSLGAPGATPIPRWAAVCQPAWIRPHRRRHAPRGGHSRIPRRPRRADAPHPEPVSMPRPRCFAALSRTSRC